MSTRPTNPLVRLSKENRRAVEQAAERLRALGYVVEEFEYEAADPTIAFFVQFLAGIREEIAGLEHPEWIEQRHKRLKMLGFWTRGPVLRWAKRWSENYGRELETVIKRYDVLLTPNVAARPAKAGVLMGKARLER